KQSIKAYLPVLNPLTDFKDFIRSKHQEKEKYIAHCLEQDRKELIKTGGKENSFLILIGPEGDFSAQEIKAALEHDFIPVSLGSSRLRTETAGVVATQIISDVISLKKQKREHY
ncbi:MAG: RsmE family RNA methyltransferase, partial [Bacteroidota bacterium]